MSGVRTTHFIPAFATDTQEAQTKGTHYPPAGLQYSLPQFQAPQSHHTTPGSHWKSFKDVDESPTAPTLSYQPISRADTGVAPGLGSPKRSRARTIWGYVLSAASIGLMIAGIAIKDSDLVACLSLVGCCILVALSALATIFWDRLHRRASASAMSGIRQPHV